jgi:hypothetical protein
MLWNASAIKGFNIQGTDGLIGTVSDLLFDDKTWQTKWLVVHTGLWLFGRKILLPLEALGTPDEDARHVSVHLTQQQIKDSPDVDTDLPVSRHVEAHVYNYYDQNPYWRSGFSPMGVVPQDTLIFMPRMGIDGDPRYHPGTDAVPDDGDPHLRSVNAVTGYHIEATDGAIGHVEDFLIDDADWRVMYVTVDTKNWLPGQRVVISPQSVREIDEMTRSVFLNVDREKIKASPPYDPEMAEDGPFNDRFHKYFGLTLLDGDELRKLKISS